MGATFLGSSATVLFPCFCPLGGLFKTFLLRASSDGGDDRSLFSWELIATLVRLLEDSEEACVGTVGIAWPQLLACALSVVIKLLDHLSILNLTQNPTKKKS